MANLSPRTSSLDDFHLEQRGLTNDDICRKCEDDELLVTIARSFDSWRSTAPYLGLKRPQIKDIEQENSNEEDRKLAVLRRWMKKNDDEATYSNFISALKANEDHEMIEHVLTCIKETNSSDTNLKVIDMESVREEDIRLLCGCGQCSYQHYLSHGCPRPRESHTYPFLKINVSSVEQKLELFTKLEQDFSNVREKFDIMFACDVRQTFVEEVGNYPGLVKDLIVFVLGQLQFSFVEHTHRNDLKFKLLSAETIVDVFESLRGSFMSWFNHLILGSITKSFRIKNEAYKQYVNKTLALYLQRSLFEISKSSFACTSDISEGLGMFVLEIALFRSKASVIKGSVISILRCHVARSIGVVIESCEIVSYSNNGENFELHIRAPSKLLNKVFPLNDFILSNLASQVSASCQDMKLVSIKYGDVEQSLSEIKVGEPISSWDDLNSTPLSDVNHMFAWLLVEIERLDGSLLFKILLSAYTHKSISKHYGKSVIPQRILSVDSFELVLGMLDTVLSFINCNLVKVIAMRLQGSRLNQEYMRYMDMLKKLKLRELPVLLHPTINIDNYCSDPLTIEFQSDNVKVVEDVILIRDSLASVHRLEPHSLILYRVDSVACEIDFLIVDSVIETIMDDSLALNRLKEAGITKIKFRGETVNLNNNNLFGIEDLSIEDDSQVSSGIIIQEYQSLPNPGENPSTQLGGDSVEWRNNVPFPLDLSYSGLEPAPYIPPIDSPPQLPHPSWIGLYPAPQPSPEMGFPQPSVGPHMYNRFEIGTVPHHDHMQLPFPLELLDPAGVSQNITVPFAVPNPELHLEEDWPDLLGDSKRQQAPHPVVAPTAPDRAPLAGMNLEEMSSAPDTSLEKYQTSFKPSLSNTNDGLQEKGKHLRNPLPGPVSNKHEAMIQNTVPKISPNHGTKFDISVPEFKPKPVTTKKTPGLSKMAPVVESMSSNKKREAWKCDFQGRLDDTVLQNEEYFEADLSRSNYRDKFYHLLCYEESEHISLLSDKCDGEYKFMFLGEKTDFYSRQVIQLACIRGMNGDQIQYASQASQSLFFVNPITQEDICEAELSRDNYNNIDGDCKVELSQESVKKLREAKLKKSDGNWLLVNIEFEVKHSYFNSLHRAVISVPQSIISKILPDNKMASSLKPSKYPCLVAECTERNLNVNHSDQFKALEAIVKYPPSVPIILTGPFGSGKTRILARSAFEFGNLGLIGNYKTRILICAHHANTVNAYRLFLTSVYDGKKRVRIIQIVKNQNVYKEQNFCKEQNFYKEQQRQSNVLDRTLFDFKNDIHRGAYMNDLCIIVITTYMTALKVSDVLSKSECSFTHVLMDEAAQVREPEVVSSLCAANKNTKIVLAGDSKQVGPYVVVLGEEARKHGLKKSLHERLEELYEHAGSPLSRYILRLGINYRCHPQLTSLLSETMYSYPVDCGVKDALVHPLSRHSPCVFHCYGVDKVSLTGSFEELMRLEADALISQVSKYFGNMPMEWRQQQCTHRDICIISPNRSQLNLIKRKLSTSQFLNRVQLLPSYVVQGHEFQAVFLSTLEHLDDYGEPSNPTKSFVTPRIFNTVLSRSKSLVVAIGDPFFVLNVEKKMGNKEKCWKNYLNFCLRYRSVTYDSDNTKKIIEKDLCEMVGVKQQAPASTEPSWQFVSGYKERAIRQSPERVGSSYATGSSWKGNSSSRVPSCQFPPGRMVGNDVKHHSSGMNRSPGQTHWTSTQHRSPNLHRPSDVSMGDYLSRPKSQPPRPAQQTKRSPKKKKK